MRMHLSTDVGVGFLIVVHPDRSSSRRAHSLHATVVCARCIGAIVAARSHGHTVVITVSDIRAEHPSL